MNVNAFLHSLDSLAIRPSILGGMEHCGCSACFLPLVALGEIWQKTETD